MPYKDPEKKRAYDRSPKGIEAHRQAKLRHHLKKKRGEAMNEQPKVFDFTPLLRAWQ